MSYLGWIMFRQGMCRLSVRCQRPVEAALVRVEGSQLEQGGNTGRFVFSPIPQAGSIEAGTLPKNRHGLLAPSGGYQRRAQIYVGHWKLKNSHK